MREDIPMNEDEILRKVMKDAELPYIADDGFTMRVMDSLPQARLSSSRRRFILILGGTLVGCVSAAALSWSSLEGFPQWLATLAPALEKAASAPSLAVVAAALSLSVTAFLAYAFREEIA